MEKYKLNSLTPEQQSLLITIREKWINQLYDLKEVNLPQLTNGINWLYTFCKMNTPKILVCESILEAQLTIHFLKYNVGTSVWANVGTSVWANVGANVRANVEDNVRANVEANVRDNVEANVRDNVGTSVWDNVGDNVEDNVRVNVGTNVWANVEDNVWANVEDNVRANVRANVWANVEDNLWANVGANVRANVEANVEANLWDNVGIESMCSYGDINDYSWVAYYDFFKEIGVLKNKDFNSFMELLQSNYYSMIQMDNVCVVIKNPKHILLNEFKQLNSTKDYAVKFNDNTGMYFVNGLYLSDELFSSLSTKKYSSDDFFKEVNEEIKAACISFIQQEFGEEYLFNFLRENLKEIDTYVDRKDNKYLIGTSGGMNVGVYTLFKGEINDTEIAYVRCYCPSTDRMFFLGVNPENTNAKDAIASLYTIPSKMKPHIKSINRQGERFSTVFTEIGNRIMSTLSKKDVNEVTTITGEEYFQLMQYEF